MKKNRIIKFRVYDIKNRRFINDLTNFWVRPNDFTSCFMEWKPKFDGEMIFEIEGNGFIYQQFIGIYGSDDKEIYEGDIVENLTKDRYVVEFSHGSFQTKDLKDGCWRHFIGSEWQLKIIGNILENPELLNANADSKT